MATKRYTHSQRVVRQMPGGAPVIETVNHDYTHSAPLPESTRVAIYLCQNFPHRTKLTQRQNRQVDRMLRRAAS